MRAWERAAANTVRFYSGPTGQHYFRPQQPPSRVRCPARSPARPPWMGTPCSSVAGSRGKQVKSHQTLSVRNSVRLLPSCARECPESIWVELSLSSIWRGPRPFIVGGFSRLRPPLKNAQISITFRCLLCVLRLPLLWGLPLPVIPQSYLPSNAISFGN